MTIRETQKSFVLQHWSAHLAIAMILLAAQSGLAADLPEPLQKDLKKIESRLDDLSRRAPRASAKENDQNLREIKQWIEEFALDAELLDSDPLMIKLNKRVEEFAKKASAASKVPAKSATKKADAEPRRRMTAMPSLVPPVNLNNVSFKKDVAPIVNNVCSRCHNSRRQSGGFDASTYNSFITMIEPGDPDGSHALNLVTGKEEPRMPRGNQNMFLREWVDIWTAWIKQGAKFDGTSKDAQIASYMIDLETQRRQMYAKMSAEELHELHRAQADRHINIVNPSKTPAFFEASNVIVYTTLSKDDAEYIAVLAEAVLEELVPRFDLPTGKPVWKGGLGVTVFADRTDYIAFAQEVDGYAPERSEFGHARMRPEYQYLAMTTDGAGMSLDGAVAQEVTRAFLMQLGNRKLPPWAIYGYSRWAASQWDGRSQALRDEMIAAARLAGSGTGLDRLLWEKGAWAELAPMSTSFFGFLSVKNKKPAAEFLNHLSRSGNWQTAITQTLRTSPEQLSQSWSGWARSKR